VRRLLWPFLERMQRECLTYSHNACIVLNSSHMGVAVWRRGKYMRKFLILMSLIAMLVSCSNPPIEYDTDTNEARFVVVRFGG
jgi:hypothetical protein